MIAANCSDHTSHKLFYLLLAVYSILASSKFELISVSTFSDENWTDTISTVAYKNFVCMNNSDSKAVCGGSRYGTTGMNTMQVGLVVPYLKSIQ